MEDKNKHLNHEVNDLHEKLSQITTSVEEKDATIQQLHKQLTKEHQRSADLESRNSILTSSEEKLKQGIKEKDGKIKDLERTLQDGVVAFAKLKGQQDEAVSRCHKLKEDNKVLLWYTLFLLATFGFVSSEPKISEKSCNLLSK